MYKRTNLLGTFEKVIVSCAVGYCVIRGSLAEPPLLVLFWKRTRMFVFMVYSSKPRRANAFGSFLEKNNKEGILHNFHSKKEATFNLDVSWL
jgi:hypothetical protein